MGERQTCKTCNWFSPYPVYSWETKEAADIREKHGYAGSCQINPPYHNGFPETYSYKWCGKWLPPAVGPEIEEAS